jgi:hypothetical protein
VVENVRLTEESDALIWCYNKTGIYSTQFFYNIINYKGRRGGGGVTPVYIPPVWNISLPPKIQLAAIS